MFGADNITKIEFLKQKIAALSEQSSQSAVEDPNLEMTMSNVSSLMSDVLSSETEILAYESKNILQNQEFKQAMAKLKGDIDGYCIMLKNLEDEISGKKVNPKLTILSEHIRSIRQEMTMRKKEVETLEASANNASEFEEERKKCTLIVLAKTIKLDQVMQEQNKAKPRPVETARIQPKEMLMLVGALQFLSLDLNKFPDKKEFFDKALRSISLDAKRNVKSFSDTNFLNIKIEDIFTIVIVPFIKNQNPPIEFIQGLRGYMSAGIFGKLDDRHIEALTGKPAQTVAQQQDTSAMTTPVPSPVSSPMTPTLFPKSPKDTMDASVGTIKPVQSKPPGVN